MYRFLGKQRCLTPQEPQEEPEEEPEESNDSKDSEEAASEQAEEASEQAEAAEEAFRLAQPRRADRMLKEQEIDEMISGLAEKGYYRYENLVEDEERLDLLNECGELR